MCDKCMDDDKVAEYLNEMQDLCIGPLDAQVRNVHLISGAGEGGSVVIVQEIDVATINEDGVNVELKKNAIVIPPEQLAGIAKFLISQHLRIGEDDGYEG